MLRIFIGLMFYNRLEKCVNLTRNTRDRKCKASFQSGETLTLRKKFDKEIQKKGIKMRKAHKITEN